MLTKKSYEMIARVIRGLPLGLEDHVIVVAAFADALAEDNLNFDWFRFMLACKRVDKQSVKVSTVANKSVVDTGKRRK